jgi:hypothetical protein
MTPYSPADASNSVASAKPPSRNRLKRRLRSVREIRSSSVVVR